VNDRSINNAIEVYWNDSERRILDSTNNEPHNRPYLSKLPDLIAEKASLESRRASLLVEERKGYLRRPQEYIKYKKELDDIDSRISSLDLLRLSVLRRDWDCLHYVRYNVRIDLFIGLELELDLTRKTGILIVVLRDGGPRGFELDPQDLVAKSYNLINIESLVQ